MHARTAKGFSSQEPGKETLQKVFSYSILFMLGTPITIVTVYGYAFYRSVKKAQLQQQQLGEIRHRSIRRNPTRQLANRKASHCTGCKWPLKYEIATASALASYFTRIVKTI